MIKGQNNHEELVEKEKEASKGHTQTHTAGGEKERISEEKNQNAYAEP